MVDSDKLYINLNMFQHFKTIVVVILRFIYFPGCYQELWQDKFLQITIFHNNFFSHVKNPACLTENRSMQLSSKHSLHTSSRLMQPINAVVIKI